MTLDNIIQYCEKNNIKLEREKVYHDNLINIGLSEPTEYDLYDTYVGFKMYNKNNCYTYIWYRIFDDGLALFDNFYNQANGVTQKGRARALKFELKVLKELNIL